MNSSRVLACFASLLLVACGSSPADNPDSGALPGDGGAPSSSDAASDQSTPPGADASAPDAATDGWAPEADGASPDATPGDGGGPDASTCTPASGTSAFTYDCAFVELAILHDGSSPPSVLLRGLAGPGALGTPACARVDAIDILDETSGLADGGHPILQTLPGVTSTLPQDGSLAVLGTGPAADALAKMCQSDANRFDGVGLVIHGHVDGGTFVSTCGGADGSWPPNVVVTCQTGVPAPLNVGDANINDLTVHGVLSSSGTMYASLPQPPVLATFDSTLHIIPEAPSFGGGPPLDPSDSAGWSGYSSAMMQPDGSVTSEVSLFSQGDTLGTTLCPPPPTCMPPTCVPTPSPVFIARMTGTTDQGPFSSELYVRTCYRTMMTIP